MTSATGDSEVNEAVKSSLRTDHAFTHLDGNSPATSEAQTRVVALADMPPSERLISFRGGLYDDQQYRAEVEKLIREELLTLDMQIATDQLMSDGSSEGTIKLLLKINGIERDPSLPPIPVRYERASDKDQPSQQGANTICVELPSLRYDINAPTNDFLKSAMQGSSTTVKLELTPERLLPCYEYGPLDVTKSEIRLMSLQQTSQLNHYTQIDIKRFPLREAPPYICLSYVWGSPTRSIPINCDGKVLMVTHNLCAGLTAIFKRYPGKYFWADGICINQDDLDERAQQVRLMDKIYSNCEFALGHLDHEIPTSSDSQQSPPGDSMSGSVDTTTTGKLASSPLGSKIYVGTRSTSQQPPLGVTDTARSVSPGQAEPFSPDQSRCGKTSMRSEREVRKKSDTQAALSLMNYMIHIWETHDDPLTTRASLWKEYNFPSASDDNFPIWKNFLHFNTHDWFFRTWIIPECVLSPKMLLIYNGCIISLHSVMRFWDLASRRGLPWPLRRGELGSAFDILRSTIPVRAFKSMREGIGSDAVSANIHAQQSSSPGSKTECGSSKDAKEEAVAAGTDSCKPQLQLLQLLAMSRMSLASDSRDKIYAMLSLAADDIAKSIVQNYQPANSVVNTYLDLAKQYINADRGHELLSYAGRDQKVQGLPSWVPDWTHQSRSLLRTHLYRCSLDTYAQISPYGKHSSMLSLRAALISKIVPIPEFAGLAWRFFEPGGENSVRQLTNDAILPRQFNGKGPAEQYRMNDEEARFASVTAALAIARLSANHLPVEGLYPEGVRHAIARTLCADRSHDGKRTNTSEVSSADFHEAFDAFERLYSQPVLDSTTADQLRQQGKLVHTSGSMTWLVECEEYGLDPLLAKVWQFSRAMQEAQRGRKFVILPPGLFALIPWDSQPGGFIMLVPGSNVPLVVRPVNDSEVGDPDQHILIVELVGDCYVHGLMDGEWIHKGYVDATSEAGDKICMIRNKQGKTHIGVRPHPGREFQQSDLLLWEDILIR